MGASSSTVLLQLRKIVLEKRVFGQNFFQGIFRFSEVCVILENACGYTVIPMKGIWPEDDGLFSGK